MSTMKIPGKIYGRARWGARRPRNTTPQTLGPKSILFIHYSDGRGAPLQNLEQQARGIRAIQNYHMDSQGWSDIGYSYVICQPYGRLKLARLFEARGPYTVPAAQVGHNVCNVAVCVIADGSEPLKASTRKLLVRIAKAFPGAYIAGHRDGGDTDCPGPMIYPHLDEIAKAAGKTHWKGGK